MSNVNNAQEIGTKVGRAIARDVLAEDMPREWTGLDAQDGDQLTAAGIEPGSECWAIAEQAAKTAYRDALGGGKDAPTRASGNQG